MKRIKTGAGLINARASLPSQPLLASLPYGDSLESDVLSKFPLGSLLTIVDYEKCFSDIGTLDLVMAEE